jgi:hypothetical protein
VDGLRRPCRVAPSDHRSAAGCGASPRMSSGAMNAGDRRHGRCGGPDERDRHRRSRRCRNQ